MYITGNDEFEPYLGKYVIMTVNGRKKKFLVESLASYTGVVPASSYIFKNNYTINGLATIQGCELCQDIVDITYFTPSSSIFENSDITLSVLTEGATALNYTWYHDNVVLAESTSAYNIPDFTVSDVGTYYVSVSCACNIINSNSTVLDLYVVEPSPSPTPTPLYTPTPTNTISPPPTPSEIIPSPSPSITPTPTVTPTPTPTSSPSPTPSPTPSSSPTPSPSPTPSDTIPTPSPTPSPSPTPYPP